MKQHDDGRKRARAERVYAWFLRLYPLAHRRIFGQQMLQTFQDHYRDAVETGSESQLRFWLGVAGDEGKSLVREQVAALRERKVAMKKVFFIAPVVGLLLLVLALSFAGPILHPLLGLMIEGLILALYAAMLVILMGYVRTFPLSGIRPMWGRLGLVLGGIFSLYVIASNVTSVLMPAPSDVGSGAILLTLPPLLMGLVGLIGGYTSDRTRTGTL